METWKKPGNVKADVSGQILRIEVFAGEAQVNEGDAEMCIRDRRHIVEECPTAEEIDAWRTLGGLPLKRFFNTSGMLYRSLGLKERLPSMSEEEQLALLASDGMLVKRPILVLPDRVLVGFRPAEWEAALAK